MFVANKPGFILTIGVCCKWSWHWRTFTYTRHVLTGGSARKPKLNIELLATHSYRTSKVKKYNQFVIESVHALSKPYISFAYSHFFKKKHKRYSVLDSGAACTLVSSALLHTVSVAPDEVINMNEFLNREQPPDTKLHYQGSRAVSSKKIHF